MEQNSKDSKASKGIQRGFSGFISPTFHRHGIMSKKFKDFVVLRFSSDFWHGRLKVEIAEVIYIVNYNFILMYLDINELYN